MFEEKTENRKQVMNMADIELVVKISEKAYNALTHAEFDASLIVDEMRKAIANGTPLDSIKAEIAEEICLIDNPYTKETRYTIDYLKLLEP